MRIAMLTNNYKPFVGGVPISIERLSEGLRDRGHDVDVIAPSYPDQVYEPGVIRYRSSKKILKGGVVIPRVFDRSIEDQIALGDYDMIHLHHPMLIGYTGMYLASKYGIPTALTIHTRYEQYLHYIPVYEAASRHRREDSRGAMHKLCSGMENLVPLHNRTIANSCDVVFAPSPYIRDILWSDGVKAPVRVLPTGLSDEDYMVNEVKAQAIRQRYLDEGQNHLFVTVSRLEKEKNLPFMLKTLLELKAQIGNTFKLLIIGTGTYEEELKAQVKTLELQENVVFTGCVEHSELSSYYGASDLFLFSSKSETQGIVILEAMAAGLPVAAVRASGVCDVVENGYNGYMTEEKTSDLASRIIELCSNKLQWHKMSQVARDTAASYSSGATAAIAEKGYIEALGRRGLSPRLYDGIGVI